MQCNACNMRFQNRSGFSADDVFIAQEKSVRTQTLYILVHATLNTLSPPPRDGKTTDNVKLKECPSGVGTSSLDLLGREVG